MTYQYTNPEHTVASITFEDGSFWSGLASTLPEGTEIAPYVPPIPQSLTMAQARLALLEAGLLDMVDAGVAQMARAAQIKWEFAATVDRADSLTQALAEQLGLSDEQMDALFVLGASK